MFQFWLKAFVPIQTKDLQRREALLNFITLRESDLCIANLIGFSVVTCVLLFPVRTQFQRTTGTGE